MKKEEKISKIVTEISGKNVVDRRIAALQAAGYEVVGPYLRWNFGRVGTTETSHGAVTVQIKHATGGKSQSGYGVNACTVVDVR